MWSCTTPSSYICSPLQASWITKNQMPRRNIWLSPSSCIPSWSIVELSASCAPSAEFSSLLTLLLIFFNCQDAKHQHRKTVMSEKLSFDSASIFFLSTKAGTASCHTQVCKVGGNSNLCYKEAIHVMYMWVKTSCVLQCMMIPMLTESCESVKHQEAQQTIYHNTVFSTTEYFRQLQQIYHQKYWFLSVPIIHISHKLTVGTL